MFLGEHTRREAQRTIDERAKNGTTFGNGSFSLAHFYPVLPRKYIIPPGARGARGLGSGSGSETLGKVLGGSNLHSQSGSGRNTNSSSNSATAQSSEAGGDEGDVDVDLEEPSLHRPFFVMQGNFGGKHAHRRDPKVS